MSTPLPLEQTRIGVLGGGQLGRMLGLAGIPMGLRFTFLDPDPQSPAAAAGDLIVAPYDDAGALDRLAASCDVATVEFESVPAAAARRLASRVPMAPSPAALETAQDRVAEKSLFRELGIPVPEFAPIDSAVDVARALTAVGLPAILKTRRFGYDGKGQRLVRTPEEAQRAAAELGGTGLIAEQVVDFARELSVLAVRGRDGDIACYPLVENIHKGGILRLSRAPAPDLQPVLQARAEGHALRVLEHLDYVGVLAIEFFDDGAGGLIASEMACRVHNSGHWTIEGAATSQFENHLRAILGLPLGATAAAGCSAMINLIGEIPDAAQQAAILGVPGAHLHRYGKSPRAGRKVGHITVCAADAATLDRRVHAIHDAIGPSTIDAPSIARKARAEGLEPSAS